MTTRFGIRAVSLLGLAFLGCSSESEQRSRLSSEVASVKSKLSLLAWDNSFTTSLIEEFEQRVGADVVLHSFDTSDEMIERLRSHPGGFDIILIDDANLHSLKEARLVRELNHGKLTNFGNISPRFRNLAFDPENRYSIPYNWGTTLVAYRSDKIVDPPHSWDLLFDDRYAGKASLLPEKTDCMASILFHLGYDPVTTNMEQVRSAEKFLMARLDNHGMQFKDVEKAHDGLLTGDQWIAMMYSSDAAAIAGSEEAEIGVIVPQEGALLWLDSFVIARDSQNPELAHQFLDYLLEPEVAASVSNACYFATANAKALPLLKRELTDDRAVYPPKETLDRCRFLSSEKGTVLELMNTSWWEIQGYKAAQGVESLLSAELEQ